jgi:Uma2 family endonuclease
MAPSYNHSYLAYRLAKLMDDEERFNVHIEITLDIDGVDYIPDIAVYPRKPIDFLHDKVKTEQRPLLVVEILSPRQAINDVTDKFELYLQSGIQSCWLIIPPTKTIIVFADIHQPQSYSTGMFVDSVLQKEISVEQVFR